MYVDGLRRQLHYNAEYARHISADDLQLALNKVKASIPPESHVVKEGGQIYFSFSENSTANSGTGCRARSDEDWQDVTVTNGRRLSI